MALAKRIFTGTLEKRFLPVNTGKNRQKIKNTQMFNTGFQNLETKFGK
jgi:hypothetical protein